jgi:hypothetical protein
MVPALSIELVMFQDVLSPKPVHPYNNVTYSRFDPINIYTL